MENLSSLLQQGHSALSRAVSDDQLDSEVTTIAIITTCHCSISYRLLS